MHGSFRNWHDPNIYLERVVSYVIPPKLQRKKIEHILIDMETG